MMLIKNPVKAMKMPDFISLVRRGILKTLPQLTKKNLGKTQQLLLL